MLTFSGKQRSVEAALAVFSHPPSLLSTPLTPPPLSFLFSSVQDDRDEMLATDQNNPPSIRACYSPHMLSRSPVLILLFSHYFSPFCVFCHSHRFVPAPPCRSGSVSYPLPPHVSSVLIFILPSLPTSFLIPSVLFLPLISPPPPPPRLPRLRSGERVGDKKRGRQRRCC